MHIQKMFILILRYKYDIPIWYSVNGEEKPMTWLHEC